ncbi:membrane protein [Candidatus Francisella endociliophora]|uniref:Membrane protein n=1 Tax=Candidatus Francisella endociliophora TaxID=653937 RepID=A0A097EQY4_9GAMM|nr:membrane protein [Francisella sp. FSC1006]AIT09981.1 membrane protein [Francisella sp. FSC1006]
MKKILVLMFGLSVISSVYAENYSMYEKPDTKSKEIAKIDDQSSQYQVIFSKGDWVEIVDKKDGKVGWVNQKSVNKQTESNTDPVEQMMQSFQQQQHMLDDHFNKMIAGIDQNIAQMQVQSGDAKPKVFKKFSSITINSDGKTAKIVKKTEDSNGNIQTVEKEVPADQLKNIKIED